MDGHQKLALQSKQWLLEALFELLKNQTFQTISVTAIADKAGVSRRTFYRLYKDKYDLLDYYSDQCVQRYVSQLNAQNGRQMSFEDIVNLFLNFWWQDRQVVKILIDRGMFHVISTRLSSHSGKLYTKYSAPWHIEGTPQEINFVTAFSFGGLWQLLETWLASEEPVMPEQVAKTLIASMQRLGDVGNFTAYMTQDETKKPFQK
ncbi:TetR/AcrR family transcriptional regulator [Leuconostoc citreum]|uniref:TetR/AcrR family transcriptional regulator n=1 Tax=Leuconostoc citreum TaxID=33964 RepID=UPI0011BB1047|nr:TetR/AcrR family transcriptional regulator [Leuconostoc citreum]MCQ6658498.1 TetR/AcrR family transcriptional regulator [Leuconostoc citreum]QEA54727.1 TetR/AcrR family transcriptional regulator [Leuconostoc citreum]